MTKKKTQESKKLRPQFWKNVALEDMNPTEWEALCDGCGKCCLIKLEDDETESVYYTNIACRLFDSGACACGNYKIRKHLVKECIKLDPATIQQEKNWMPATCAYRLLADGEALPKWHPLITGDKESTHSSGNSMQDKTVAEYDVPDDEWQDYIIEDLS